MVRIEFKRKSEKKVNNQTKAKQVTVEQFKRVLIPLEIITLHEWQIEAFQFRLEPLLS